MKPNIIKKREMEDREGSYVVQRKRNLQEGGRCVKPNGSTWAN